MAGNKKYLTDRGLKALVAAKPGQRYEIWDSRLVGLGVRVSDQIDKQRPGKAGRISFVYYRRYPGSQSPVRRLLGRYPMMTLDAARKKAGDWDALIKQGKDPALEEQRTQRENQRRQKNTFACVAEDYVERRVIGSDPERPLQRNGPAVAYKLRNVLVPLWGAMPITEVTSDDVKRVIESVRDLGTERMLAAHGIKTKRSSKKRKGGAPGRARNLLAELKAFFRWAVAEGVRYGLQSSPCTYLSATSILGEKRSVDRILSDDQLLAFWRATSDLPYPFGPYYQLLLLTGVRLNELADATWQEFNFADQLWTIPPTRMKGKHATARPHVVPLNANMLKILEALPRFQGDYLFSISGAKPVSISSDVKTRLDGAMLSELREIAKQRDDDPDKVTLPHWTNHDLRRVLRSGLSRLRIHSDVAEAVLSHVKAGVRGVYDRYDLLDEKRYALEAWAARVRSIVEAPASATVIDPQARR